MTSPAKSPYAKPPLTFFSTTVRPAAHRRWPHPRLERHARRQIERIVIGDRDDVVDAVERERATVSARGGPGRAGHRSGAAKAGAIDQRGARTFVEAVGRNETWRRRWRTRRVHGDRDDGLTGHRGAIRRDVGERVRTTVTGGRRVAERSVRVQRQRAVCRRGRELRLQRRAVDIGIVAEHARRS